MQDSDTASAGRFNTDAAQRTGLFACAVLAYFILLLGQRYLIQDGVDGLFELGVLQDHIMPLLATIGTFLGVVSKSVYIYLNDRRKSLYRGAISAMLISPIVLLYSYNAIVTLADNLFVAFLVAYQNGFFFRIVANLIEDKIGKAD